MEIIGILAGLFLLLAYAPQAIKTIRTQKTRDLSLLTLSLLTTSALLWVVYGLLMQLPALWVTNSIVSAFVMIILIVKIKNKK